MQFFNFLYCGKKISVLNFFVNLFETFQIVLIQLKIFRFILFLLILKKN